MGQLHDAILETVINDDRLLADGSFVRRLDALATAATTVRVTGELQVSREGEETTSDRSGATLTAEITPEGPRLGASFATEEQGRTRDLIRETRRGRERLGLNFSEVAKALRELVSSLSTHRVWILLDEWSSVPTDVQPMLGEFLVRCVLPLQDRITVKIAAIEQQSRFRQQITGVGTIGIELGADVAANLDLDEFMVFEQNEERSRSFFRGLLFKHITAGQEAQQPEGIAEIKSEGEFVSQGFTDRRAFDELVRAAEGVPRDAINIAAKAALRASAKKISVPDVRAAARAWFLSDKEAALSGRPEAIPLLNWIIDRVIRERRARGFLVNQKSAAAPLLLALFDARVLHVSCGGAIPPKMSQASGTTCTSLTTGRMST